MRVKIAFQENMLYIKRGKIFMGEKIAEKRQGHIIFSYMLQNRIGKESGNFERKNRAQKTQKF